MVPACHSGRPLAPARRSSRRLHLGKHGCTWSNGRVRQKPRGHDYTRYSALGRRHVAHPRSDADTWHVPARTPTRGTWRRRDGTTNYNQARWRAAYCNWRAPHGWRWGPFVGRPHCAACAATIHERARAINRCAVRCPNSAPADRLADPSAAPTFRRQRRHAWLDAARGGTIICAATPSSTRYGLALAGDARTTITLAATIARDGITDATHLRRRT